MNLIAHLQRQNNIITTFIYTWLIYSKVNMNKEAISIIFAISLKLGKSFDEVVKDIINVNFSILFILSPLVFYFPLF